MTTYNFWEFAPKQQVNQQLAKTWADQALKKSQELTHPQGIHDGTTLDDTAVLTQPQQDEIVPKPKGNIIGDLVGTAFGGPIDQPWDLLRPIKRIQDFQTQHIARPISKAIVQDVLGVNYNSLPGVAKFGLETLFSPTSWVGGMGALRGLGVATENLPWAVKLGIGIVAPEPIIQPGTLISLAKKAPRLATSLPSIRAAILGPGSDRGAQILISDFAHSQFPNDPEKALMLTKGLASEEAALRPQTQRGVSQSLHAALQRSVEGKSILDKITAGTHTDEDLARAQDIVKRNLRAKQTRPTGPSMGIMGGGVQDNSDLDPLVQELLGLKPSGPSEAVAGGMTATDRAQSGQPGPNSPMDAMRSNIARGMSDTELTGKLDEISTDLEQLTKDQAAGKYGAQENLWNAKKDYDLYQQELMSRGKQGRVSQATRSSGGAAAAYTPSMNEILDNLNSLPDSILQAKGPDEVVQDAAIGLSLTKRMRQATFNQLPDDVASAIEKYGPRLFDGDLGPLLTQHARMRAISHNFGSGIADQIPLALQNVERDTVGRVISIAGKPVSGLPHLEDLIRNAADYNLSPDQIAVLHTIADPIHHALDVARAFKVQGVPENATDKGLWVAIKPDKEQAVAIRYGSRQPSQYPDPFPSKADAIAAGQKVSEFVTAQQSAVNQFLNAASDNWLREAIAPYGKTINDLLPQGLLQARNTSTMFVRQLDTMDRVLTRSIDSRRAHFSLPPNMKYPPQIQPIVDKALGANAIPVGKGYMAARRAMLRQAKSDLAAVMQPVKDVHELAKSRLANARQIIYRAKGTEQYPAAFGGRYYPEELGRQLSQELTPRESSDPITWFNRIARPLMSTLDLSFASHQGLLGLATNPAAYVKSLHAAFSSQAFDGLVEHAAKTMLPNGQSLLHDALQHNVSWLARNDLGEFMFTGALEKVPGVKAANTWFARFGNAMRLHLYESMLPLAKDDAAKFQLAHTLNLATGITENSATKIEQMVEFAPRFFRANIGMISDALTRGDLSGEISRKMLRNLLTMSAGLTYGINQLTGAKTEFDPRKADFLQMNVAGQKISILGQYETLLRGAQKFFGGDPVGATKYMARSKASPSISHLWDVITGETYGGSPLDFHDVPSTMTSLWKEARSNLPLSAYQGAESLYDHGLTPEGIGGAAINLTALRSIPMTAVDKRENLAAEAYGKRWNELEPSQKLEIESSHPEANVIPTSQAFKARESISKHFQDLQAQLDSRIPPGPEWKDAYDNLRQQEVGAYAEWAQEHPDASKALQSTPARDPNSQALQTYYGIFEQAQHSGLTGEEVTRQIADLENSWSSDQKAYVQRNTGLRGTPTVQEYRSAQRLLTPYWQIEDDVWARLTAHNVYGQYPDLNSFIQAQVQDLKDRGVPDDQAIVYAQRLPLVSQVSSMVSTLRRRYRVAHPEVDAVLSKWYGTTPIRLQQR